jgi:NAD(P)-dependent dehydrogenase (short-subunit alcohol dehydrogenase family)
MTMNNLAGKLAGKVAIITGSGQGIGREYARLFASEGAQVVVNDAGVENSGVENSGVESGEGGEGLPLAQRVAEQIATDGGTAIWTTDEIGSSESAERLMDAAVAAYGRVDILVNNAGILRDRTILKMMDDEWDDVIRVHLTGTFTCLRAAARVMKEQGKGGRIINTSSSSGLLGNFGQANYGAAKAGIYALTRIAAEELTRHNITVNAIAPLAATRLLATLPYVDFDAVQESLAPGRIAPMAAYLASDAAAHLTGITFGVEGNELFVYRMMTTHGVTRYEPSAWTIDAIQQSIDKILSW